MREMRWDWATLQATPAEVRTYCWDFIQIERTVEADRAAARERARKDEPGTMRIAR